MDEQAVTSAMQKLADILDYQPINISWLANAMNCSLIHTGKHGKNRAAYTNGKIVVLGEYVLKAIESGEPFSGVEITDEDLNRKRKYQDYKILFQLNMKSEIHRYAYDKYGFYYEAPVMVKPPLPACDLYVEAVAGAIYLDRGFEYTKEWVRRFFEKNGFSCNRIYGHKENKKDA